MSQVEHVIKAEISFSNAYLAKNFQDGLIWKLDNMRTFLRSRVQQDEYRAQKMVDQDRTDDPDFDKLVSLIAANEASLVEIGNALAKLTSEFKQRWNEDPPSLKPKEQRDGYVKKEQLAAVKARFSKKAA